MIELLKNENDYYTMSITSNCGSSRSELKAKPFTTNTAEIYVLNQTQIPYPADMLERLKNEYIDYYTCRLFGFDIGDKSVVVNFGDYDFLLEVNNWDLTFWTEKICKELKAIPIIEI